VFPSHGPRGSESILLVEDDSILRVHIAAALGDLGYSVRGVADALEALRLVTRGHPFDLLLTNVIVSGGMSGPELAALLRRRWPDLSVLYISGQAVTSPLAASLQHERHSALLSKPFRRHKLATALRALLDQHEAAAAGGP
jgi:CheY-like chemotaxis protein